MKVLKLVLIVILMSNFYGKAQEIADSIKSADLVNLAYEARMDEIFENVDFSYIPPLPRDCIACVNHNIFPKFSTLSI